MQIKPHDVHVTIKDHSCVTTHHGYRDKRGLVIDSPAPDAVLLDDAPAKLAELSPRGSVYGVSFSDGTELLVSVRCHCKTCTATLAVKTHTVEMCK